MRFLLNFVITGRNGFEHINKLLIVRTGCGRDYLDVRTLAIISLICSIWSVTRGWWVGRRHWRSSMSFRNSWQNRPLKAIGSSPVSLARLIIWKEQTVMHQKYYIMWANWYCQVYQKINIRRSRINCFLFLGQEIPFILGERTKKETYSPNKSESHLVIYISEIAHIHNIVSQVFQISVNSKLGKFPSTVSILK